MKSIDSNRKDYISRFGWCRDSMLKSWGEGIYGQGFAADGDEWCAVRSADFIFCAGEPGNLSDFAEYLRGSMGKYIAIIPESGRWADALAACGVAFKTVTRYHTRLPEGGFDTAALEAAVSSCCAKGCIRIVRAGENDYEALKNCEWEWSFVSNFKDREDFLRNGFGFVCYVGEELASAATTFGYYSGGYELQIATNPKFRRRGLAGAVGAAFILECLRRGRRPHWDAANLTSVRIAQRLGFEYDGEYTAYEIEKP